MTESRDQPEQTWRPISEWRLSEHGPHVMGYCEGHYGVAEYRYFHEGGWHVGTFKGQVIRLMPHLWKPMPQPPYLATQDKSST